MYIERFGNAWLQGVPASFRRVDNRVEVLHRIPYEPDIWIVRHPNGVTEPVSGSMLKRDGEG